jgi:hypothetical protein
MPLVSLAEDIIQKVQDLANLPGGGKTIYLQMEISSLVKHIIITIIPYRPT